MGAYAFLHCRDTPPGGVCLSGTRHCRIDDALPAGERALVWIGNYSKARCAFDMSDASVRQALTTLAGDPKVAGYYLADEADDALPTYGGHCPHVATQVTQRNRLVHQLAPGAFT